MPASSFSFLSCSLFVPSDVTLFTHLYMVLTFHPPPCAAWLLCLLLFFLPVVFLFYIFLHLALLFIIVPPLQLAVHLHVG